MKGFVNLSDTKQLVILIVCVVAWGVGVSNWLETTALSQLLDVSEKGIVCLGTVFGFKTLAASGTGVPIISGTFSSVEETLGTAEQYLTISNALVLAQIVLLSIGKSLVFKAVSFLALVGTLFTATRKISLKIFVLSVLLSPGLAIYVAGIQTVVKEVHIDYHSELSEKLDSINARVEAHESEHEAALHDLMTQQRAHDLQEGDSTDTLKWWQRLEDHLGHMAYTMSDKVSSGLQKTIVILKDGGKEIISSTLNVLVSSLLQFLLLPGLYAYFVLTLVKRFFGVEVQVNPVVLRPKQKSASANTSSQSSNTNT